MSLLCFVNDVIRRQISSNSLFQKITTCKVEVKVTSTSTSLRWRDLRWSEVTALMRGRWDGSRGKRPFPEADGPRSLVRCEQALDLAVEYVLVPQTGADFQKEEVCLEGTWKGTDRKRGKIECGISEVKKRAFQGLGSGQLSQMQLSTGVEEKHCYYWPDLARRRMLMTLVRAVHWTMEKTRLQQVSEWKRGEVRK